MASVRVAITKDDIQPAIKRLTATGRDTTPVMRAMGNTFKSITEGNFNSAGADYRPAPWKPKADGSPSILQKTTTMAKAFHLDISKDRATLTNSTPYATIHQFGGIIKPKSAKLLSWMGPDGKRRFALQVEIPARPFYPIANGKLTSKAEEKIAAAGRRAVERAAAP